MNQILTMAKYRTLALGILRHHTGKIFRMNYVHLKILYMTDIHVTVRTSSVMSLDGQQNILASMDIF